MKKKGLIIASLLILVLSVFFMGCPPEEKDPAILKDEAIAALGAIGYTKAVPLPSGTTYDTCKGDSSKVAIAWTGGSKPIFDAYASKFGVTRGAEFEPEDFELLTTEHLGDGFKGTVAFAGDASGPYNGIDVKKNSIILIIIKN